MEPEAMANDAYDALAEGYAARIDTKAHNAYYERPATWSLLGPVAGKRVLDAGCGVGIYAELLLEAGADVVAVDANAKMLEMARLRLKSRPVELVHATLERKMDFLGDASFDLIVCALVLDYVYDWHQVFGEFHRVLKPGGVVVYSVTHPFVDYVEHHHRGNYFAVERVEYLWRGFGTEVQVPSYRRSIGDLVTPLLAKGFQLQAILEPRPQAAFMTADPEEYEKLMYQPGFICLKGLKRP